MDTVNIDADWVGRVIDGRFPLLQWLGGSNGSGVFLTELDGPRSQRAAIKVMAANYASAQAQLARWTEAAKLSHPHLMKLLHTGRGQADTTGVVYSVTDYADEVLADVLKERALKPDEVKEMLVPVLDALFYLHGKGYVYGHLKPSNILAVRNQLQLSGDGLQVAGEPGKWFRGLTRYDAPETGEVVMAPVADVWSVGMLLVAALTQKPAEWDREARKEPAIPAVPEPFARMARGCLRWDAARRCTLADLNKARFEQVRPESATAENSLMAAAAEDEDQDDDDTTRKRRGRIVIVAAAAVAVALAIFGMVHFGRSPESGRAQKPAATVGAVKPGALAAATEKEATTTEAEKSPVAQPAVKKPSPNVPKAASTPSETAAVGTSTNVATARAPKENTQEPSQQAVPARATGGSGAIAHRVLPEAPQDALDTIHGTVRVWVRVAVDASGNVTEATFQDAGPSKYFARLAMAAAREWRFKAGAPGAWRLEFEFRQTGIEVAPKELGE